MLVERKELENTIKNILSTITKEEERSAYVSSIQNYFFLLVNDLRKYKAKGGDVESLKNTFLLKLMHSTTLKNKQKDFVLDLMDVISGRCSVVYKL